VIDHPSFAIEPWAVRETALDVDRLAQTESVFALANGHLGLRANLDEGEPFGIPGTYLAGFYEVRPLPYAEGGFGYPEDGQTVVNVTNGKLIRLLVEDEPFDIRYGQLRSHERVLDLRAGVLRRTAEWLSPTGTAVRVRTTRIVSFAQRAVAAIHYEVEPIELNLYVTGYEDEEQVPAHAPHDDEPDDHHLVEARGGLGDRSARCDPADRLRVASVGEPQGPIRTNREVLDVAVQLVGQLIFGHDAGRRDLPD
jgi:alpha,alpha-trehalose phosphorylase